MHRDPDLYFQGQQFLNVNIAQTVRASAKISDATLGFIFVIEWHYYKNVVLHDLDLNFQGKQFETLIDNSES